jgi:tRNA(Met) C34 N-acetyltransferase TmcA
LLMRQVFSLLALAHYKTTPQDLRILMDHPALTMHCWFDAHGRLVGVACLMAEGELSRGLALAVACGQRRIKGHWLAQILAQQAGLSIAAELRMQRVQRIAVHPGLQRQGIGKAMLAHLQKLYSHSGGTQWLGSSFAAEPEVVRFWLAAGYQPVWAGKTLDAATGLPSLQVVLPMDASAESCCQLLRAHFYFYHTHLVWNSPLSELICQLIQPRYKGAPKPIINALVRQVGDAHGNVYSITPYLYNYLLASDTLSDEAKVWLSHFWQPQLTYKQFVQLTRKLVRQVQFDDSPEDVVAG